MLFKSVCIHEKAAQHKIFSARDVVVVADLFDFLLGSSSLRIFYVACLLVPQQDFLILVCSLFSIHFTQSVLKFHIQNINFTIMNIIAITVFIHFSPHLLLRTYMVSRMTCVYHYILQIWNQIKEKGRKVHHHQREKTKEWKTKRI